jgi:hypothetical protein
MTRHASLGHFLFNQPQNLGFFPPPSGRFNILSCAGIRDILLDDGPCCRYTSEYLPEKIYEVLPYRVQEYGVRSR